MKEQDNGYITSSGVPSNEYTYYYPVKYYKKTGQLARAGFRRKKAAKEYQKEFLEEYLNE
jgi:hypothetical protein